MEYLIIGIGGFLGANARYLLGGWITRQWGAQFPWGTFVINVTGSFFLGLLMAYLNARPLSSPHYRLFFAVGFLGAYTTFSTFSYETLRLVQDQSVGAALWNIIGSFALGLVGVSLGIFVGALFTK
jgi:fluoride exporter